jgi:hypothetical protein
MTKRETARLAGFVYLLLVITGIFNLVYVPTQLIVWADAAATVNNIKSNEFLFRSGIAAGVLCYIFYLLLPFILFELFKTVNKTMAVLMVILAVVSVPLSLFNMIDKYNVLTLLNSTQYLDVFTVEQINAKVMLLLRSYNNGIMIIQIFWGLWLFPFGYLVFKSSYVPKFFGVLLMLGCLSYLIKFFGAILYPEVEIPRYIGRPGSLGEIGICLWLLIMSIKDKTLKDKAL